MSSPSISRVGLGLGSSSVYSPEWWASADYALVPGLIYLLGAPVHVTMGTSLATMIPLAVVGGGIKLAQGYLAIVAGLLLASGTVVGAQTSAAIIKSFKAETLRLIFGPYFLYVAAEFITITSASRSSERSSAIVQACVRLCPCTSLYSC